MPQSEKLLKVSDHKDKTQEKTHHVLASFRMVFTNVVTKEMTSFPKKPFFIMGTLECLSHETGCLVDFQLEHVKFCVQVHLIVWVPFLHARAPGDLVWLKFGTCQQGAN